MDEKPTKESEYLENLMEKIIETAYKRKDLKTLNLINEYWYEVQEHLQDQTTQNPKILEIKQILKSIESEYK